MSDLFMAMKFTKGEVVSLVGITPTRLSHWTLTEIIGVDESGMGNYRQYSFMQTLGIAVAWAVYTSDHGCCLDYCKAVIAKFGATNLDWLNERLKKGRVWLIGVTERQGIWLTDDEKTVPSVNVADLLTKLVNGALEIKSREAEPKVGRRRGLARPVAE